MVSPLSNQLHINNECYNNDAGFQCIFWKAQYNLVSKASSCMLSHSISMVQLKLSIIISVLAWTRINTVCKMQHQLGEVSIDIAIASCIEQCAAFFTPFFSNLLLSLILFLCTVAKTRVQQSFMQKILLLVCSKWEKMVPPTWIETSVAISDFIAMQYTLEKATEITVK